MKMELLKGLHNQQHTRKPNKKGTLEGALLMQQY